MKIGALSDMHGDFPYVENCDVLCICGDTVPLKLQWDDDKCIPWIINEFFDWVYGLPCLYVVWIAGNHDATLQSWGKEAIRTAIRESNLANKLFYLEDDLIELDGVKFYGCPWCINLDSSRWAFVTGGEKYLKIPDCDVLLTHQPPFGDVGFDPWQRRNFGSTYLRSVIEDRNIKLCCSGHTHQGMRGPETIGKTKCYNVSVKDDYYNLRYPVTYIDYEIVQ